MIGLESLRWALTLALVAGSAFHLVRSVRPAGTEGRPAESLYLLMGVAMIAMIWPWGSAVPAAGWVAVFVLAAGWFTIRAARSTRRIVPAFFASAMAAMAWMGAATPAHPVGHTVMPGMAGGAGTAWITGGLGIYFMLAALWWVGAGMHLAGPHASETGNAAVGPDAAAPDAAALTSAGPGAAASGAARLATVGRSPSAPGTAAAATDRPVAVWPTTVGVVAHPVRWSWLCHGMMTAAMAVALLAMA